MTLGAHRVVLSLAFSLAALSVLLPLDAWASDQTEGLDPEQSMGQVIERYIRTHPEVIEQSLQAAYKMKKLSEIEAEQ